MVEINDPINPPVSPGVPLESSSSRSLPGPRSRLLSTWQMVRDPFGSYRRWFAEYGDPLAVPTLHGRVIFTANPEGVRAVFTAEADDVSPFLPEVFRPFLGDSSVVLSSGPQHRRERKLLGPVFHSARLGAQVPGMVAACESVVSRLQPGARVSLRALMQDVTLRVIAEAILCAGEAERADRIARAAYDLVSAFHPVLLFAPALHREFVGLGPFARFNRAARSFDALLIGEIVRRRAVPGSDILGIMLAARDEDGVGLDDLPVAHQLRTLLFAGYETTGLALAWAVYWLGVHSELRARVVAEVEAVGDPVAAAEACPLLAAFCDEVLRVSPILPEVRRTLRAPMTLGGHALPPGAHVSVPMAVAHMRPETFPEPERFLPERFLARRYSPFEFFPWGGGNRRCLAAAFATLELRAVLATLLLRFRLHSLQRGPVQLVRHSATMWPRCGLPAVYEGRR